jgi:cell division GTPase FtsZ
MFTEVKQQEFKLPIAENKPNQTTTILNTASHDNHEFLLKPKIVLVGIGGGGGSTINNMIKRKLTGE